MRSFFFGPKFKLPAINIFRRFGMGCKNSSQRKRIEDEDNHSFCLTWSFDNQGTAVFNTSELRNPGEVDEIQNLFRDWIAPGDWLEKAWLHHIDPEATFSEKVKITTELLASIPTSMRKRVAEIQKSRSAPTTAAQSPTKSQ